MNDRAAAGEIGAIGGAAEYQIAVVFFRAASAAGKKLRASFAQNKAKRAILPPGCRQIRRKSLFFHRSNTDAMPVCLVWRRRSGETKRGISIAAYGT